MVDLNIPKKFDFLTYTHIDVVKSSARTPYCFRSLKALLISVVFASLLVLQACLFAEGRWD